MSKMPRTSSSKSRTPTVKSNRIVRLLKKKKSGKSKSSKTNDYIDERPPPTIAHRKSAPFMIGKHKHFRHNITDPCRDSSASEREDSQSHSQTHQSYHSHASLPQLHPNHRSTNTITRTVPPPPAYKGSKSAYDRNININIDINKLRSNTLRSRSRGTKDEPLSPVTPMSPQSPAERFISHIPDHSIEGKVNMKQLLYEMIDMKRQIKSLKKDMKHLKTENDLCHRRISFLEQVLDNQNVQAGYVSYAQTAEPQKPCADSRTTEDTTRSDEDEDDKYCDSDDMERRLKDLSKRLAKANVFTEEYRQLENELEKLIQQQEDKTGEDAIATRNYYDEMDESKHSEYNDATVIVREKPRTEGTVENDRNSMKRYYRSESDHDDTDEKEKEDVKVVRYEAGPLQKVRSSYTLSRRRTKQSMNKRKYEKNKDDTDDTDVDGYHHKYIRKKPNVNERMEMID
eukprot:194284_1